MELEVEFHSRLALGCFPTITVNSTGGIETRWLQRKPVAVAALSNGSVLRVSDSKLLECNSVGFSTDLRPTSDLSTCHKFFKYRVLKQKAVLCAIKQRIDNAILEYVTVRKLRRTEWCFPQMTLSSFLATQLRTTKLLSRCCLVACNSSDNARPSGCQTRSVKEYIQSSMGSTTTLNLPLQAYNMYSIKCIEDVQNTTDMTLCSKIVEPAIPVYKWMTNAGQLLEELMVKVTKGNSSSGSRLLLYTSLLLSVLLLLSSASCLQVSWRLKGNPTEATFIFVAVYSFHSVATLPSPCQNEIHFRDTRVVHGGMHRVSLRGSPNSGFCARIVIGTDTLQEFCVLVDTGSANLAVAGREHLATDSYFQINLSSSYTDLGTSVSVSYTAGEWTGTLSQDYISIGGASRILAHFVLITKANQFFLPNTEWEGILGMAYSSLAKPDSSIKTFWETFKEANNMEDVFSIQLCPPIDNPVHNRTELKDGIMVLGGSDPNDYRGAIHFTNIIEQKYYSVVITNLTVGNNQINIPCKEFNNDQTIVDSGTTDIFFPVKVFAELEKALSSNLQDNERLTVPESFWVGGSKLAWPTMDKSYIYDAFPTLFIGFAISENSSQEFSLAITPQIYLRQVQGSHDEQLRTNCLPECDFFEFGIKRRERGTVIGGNVMLGFYTVFNRKDGQVGFAEAAYCAYQDPTTLPYIVGPYQRVPEDCECHGCSPGPAYWEIISYVCGVIVFLVTILLLVYVTPIKRICKSCKKRKFFKLSSSKKDLCVKCLCRCICCKYKKLTVHSTNAILSLNRTEDSTELFPSLELTSENNDDEPHDSTVGVQIVHEQETVLTSQETSAVSERGFDDHNLEDEIEVDFDNDPDSSEQRHLLPEEADKTKKETDKVKANVVQDSKDVEDSGFAGDDGCNSIDQVHTERSSQGDVCTNPASNDENTTVTATVEIHPARAMEQPIDPEQSISKLLITTITIPSTDCKRQASNDSGFSENDSLPSFSSCDRELETRSLQSSQEPTTSIDSVFEYV